MEGVVRMGELLFGTTLPASFFGGVVALLAPAAGCCSPPACSTATG